MSSIYRDAFLRKLDVGTNEDKARKQICSFLKAKEKAESLIAQAVADLSLNFSFSGFSNSQNVKKKNLFSEAWNNCDEERRESMEEQRSDNKGFDSSYLFESSEGIEEEAIEHYKQAKGDTAQECLGKCKTNRRHKKNLKKETRKMKKQNRKMSIKSDCFVFLEQEMEVKDHESVKSHFSDGYHERDNDNKKSCDTGEEKAKEEMCLKIMQNKENVNQEKNLHFPSLTSSLNSFSVNFFSFASSTSFSSFSSNSLGLTSCSSASSSLALSSILSKPFFPLDDFNSFDLSNHSMFTCASFSSCSSSSSSSLSSSLSSSSLSSSSLSSSLSSLSLRYIDNIESMKRVSLKNLKIKNFSSSFYTLNKKKEKTNQLNEDKRNSSLEIAKFEEQQNKKFNKKKLLSLFLLQKEAETKAECKREADEITHENKKKEEIELKDYQDEQIKFKTSFYDFDSINNQNALKNNFINYSYFVSKGTNNNVLRNELKACNTCSSIETNSECENSIKKIESAIDNADSYQKTITYVGELKYTDDSSNEILMNYDNHILQNTKNEKQKKEENIKDEINLEQRNFPLKEKINVKMSPEMKNNFKKKGWRAGINFLKNVMHSQGSNLENNIETSQIVVRSSPSNDSRIRSNLQNANLDTPYSVQTKVNLKTFIELSNVFCLKRLTTRNAHFLCLCFSPNNTLLAAGDQYGCIHVWFIFLEKQDQKNKTNFIANEESDLFIIAHSDAIMNIFFLPIVSNSDRFISTSLEKSIKIFDINKGEKSYSEICKIECADFPSSAVFHPLHHNFIYVGCLDATISVWNIKKESKSKSLIFPRLIEKIEAPDLVTAISISPNGTILVVGLKSGSIIFYEANSLKFRSEVDCRNRRGKTSSGRKVSSLTWSKDGSAICVTTSDSRIRILDTKDSTVIAKFKGHQNNRIMLHAFFDEKEKHVICGSEDGSVFIWDLHNSHIPAVNPKFNLKKQKKPTNFAFESFKAFDNEILACCCVVPSEIVKKIKSNIFLKYIQHENQNYKNTLENFDKVQVTLIQSPLWMLENNGYNAKDLCVAVASTEGEIKFFMNFGDTLKR